MANYLTYLDIIQAVERAIKQTSSSKNDLVEAMVNMVYLNEIMVADELWPLFWLRRFNDSRDAVGPTTITAISQAATGLVTAASHGLAAGDIFSIYNVSGMTEVNNRVFKVGTAAQGFTADILPLTDLDGTAVDTTGYTAYSSGGTVVHRGITLTDSVEKILSAGWHDEAPMSEADPSMLEEKTQWWNDSTTRPEKYLHDKRFTNAGAETNHLFWFQGSNSAYDLRYWFELRPTRLSADTDVPLLPVKFHDMLISGTITRLKENNVQVENEIVWPTLYQAQLNAFLEYNRNFYRQHEKDRRAAPYLL